MRIKKNEYKRSSLTRIELGKDFENPNNSFEKEYINANFLSRAWIFPKSMPKY